MKNYNEKKTNRKQYEKHQDKKQQHEQKFVGGGVKYLIKINPSLS